MTNIEELKRMAEQGNAEAQFLLGSIYLDENNGGDGIKWLRKSAMQGYGFAQDCICMCYEYGIGVPKDRTEANYWGKKAYENERRGAYVPNAYKQPQCIQRKIREVTGMK